MNTGDITSTLPSPTPAEDSAPWLKRRVTTKRWVALAVGVALVASIAAAAQAAPTRDKLKEMTEKRDEALDRLSDAEEQIDTLNAVRDSTQEDMTSAQVEADEAIAQAAGEQDQAIKERDAAEDERDAAIDERDAALSEADKARTDLQAVLTRFDPQIQAAIASLVANADNTVCFVGDASGFSGQPIPSLDSALEPIVSAVPDAALPGGPSEYLSMPALAVPGYEVGDVR